MKLANPYFPHPHVKCTFPNDDVMVLSGSYLDLPEDSEILLTPVEKGRSDAAVVGPAKVFVPGMGVMEMADWNTRNKVKEEKAQIEREKKEMADRKAKEARERAQTKKAVSEKPKKVVEEKREPKVDDKKMDMGDKLEL